MRSRILIYIGICLVLAVGGFNSCTLKKNLPESSLDLSTLATPCDGPLLEAFRPYHQVLTQKCNSCHVSGGQGNGRFADGNEIIAYNTFKLKGENLVYQFATSASHRAPYSGPDNVALLTTPRASWNGALPAYQTCLASLGSGGGDVGGGGGDGGGGGGATSYAQPMIQTTAKALPAAAAINTSMVWNLATEVADTTKAQAGATITVTVNAIDLGGGNFVYYISAPTIRGANSGSLYVKNLGVYLNSVFLLPPSGATFQYVNRYIPQAGTRNLAPNGGSMVIAMPTLANNQIALAFERFEQATVDGQPYNFNPPTHTRLISTTDPQRVFQAKCMPCHSGANPTAGFNITNYFGLLGAYIIPFAPSSSYVLERMVLGQMPPPNNGLQVAPATPAEIESVRQWILDGAPR